MSKFICRLLGFLLLTLTNLVQAQLVGIDPDQVEEMVNKQNAIVVDVRTAREWNTTGTIPASKKLTFFDENGESKPKQWLAELNRLKRPDQPVILVCHSGGRSAKVGRYLSDEIGMKQVYHLEDGITGWKEKGKITQP